MKILSGNNTIDLVNKIMNLNSNDYVRAEIDRFQDQELRIQILDNLENENIIVVQSTSNPVNDSLLELLLLIDAAKFAGAKKITAIIPYFGYGRQDSNYYNYGPNAARLVARILETAGIDELISVDLHSQKIEKFFSVPVYNIDPSTLFIPFIKLFDNPIIVAPDKGSEIRAGNLATLLDLDIAVCHKNRTFVNKCSISEVIGNVDGRDCIIFDDIVDTANSLCAVTKILQHNGAKTISACVTHAVLSNGSVEAIQESFINKIYVTDTINLSSKSLSDKFHILSIADIISDYIATIY